MRLFLSMMLIFIDGFFGKRSYVISTFPNFLPYIVTFGSGKRYTSIDFESTKKQSWSSFISVAILFRIVLLRDEAIFRLSLYCLWGYKIGNFKLVFLQFCKE